MIELLTMPTSQLPSLWKWQILAFQRIVWTEGFVGKHQGRDWITREADHPISLLLVDGERVLAHVNVVWKTLQYIDSSYKAYGLTGVFTFPERRGQGYGLQLVQHATKYIDRQDGDIALFHCDPDNVAFYQRAGWEARPDAQTLIGSRSDPTLVTEILMLRQLSPHGQRFCDSLAHETLFFDADSTW